MALNGDVSHWVASIPRPTPRPPLPGDLEADVCIVGAGFTGLWSAFYLKRERPDLRVVVLERDFAGFGASGRNGGWLNAEFAASRKKVAREHGRAAVLATHRAMRETVDEVQAVCRREGIKADIVSGGTLLVARGPAQLQRVREHLAEDREWGLGDEVVELDAAEMAARIRVQDGIGGLYTPLGARVQPARLVSGLAAAVERLGVEIYERTEVRGVASGCVSTDRGVVRADSSIICLEGFLSGLPGWRRERMPLNSAIVVTEPLSSSAWDAIGWEGRELLGDLSHAYFYAQRTADDRIALGGRGVPYRYGSRIDVGGRTQGRTIAQLSRILRDVFPVTRDARIDHAWCGVLGVPRDWTPSVRFDRDSGIGLAGGYVGSGVATSNLAGRTMRDLVLERSTDLTALPWSGHTSRRWEPEPLRYLGTQLVYSLFRAADRRESRGLAQTSRLAGWAGWISGR